MKYIIKAYNIWELGQREKQEDSMFPPYNEVNDSDRLFILCDGMGGHSAGEVASDTVCRSMSESVSLQCPDAEGKFSDDNFRQALSDAFDALDTKDNGATKKMGTTLTFLKLHEEGCTIAHIGDSRVYHIRPGNNADDTEILFQTYDHSLVNDLIRVGQLTPEEAKHSKQKNVITRAMQPLMERRPKADIYHSHDIQPGDYFMLCSDGILENFEDDNIKYIFSARAGDDPKKVDMLIKATENNRDNHSAIIVHILDVINPIGKHAEGDGNECAIGCEDTSKEQVSADAPSQDAPMAYSVTPSRPSMPSKSHGNSGKLPYLKYLVALIIVALLCWGIFTIFAKL